MTLNQAETLNPGSFKDIFHDMLMQHVNRKKIQAFDRLLCFHICNNFSTHNEEVCIFFILFYRVAFINVLQCFLIWKNVIEGPQWNCFIHF